MNIVQLDIVQPLNSFTLLPGALSDLAGGISVNTFSILLASLPITLVFFAIGPRENAETFFVVVNVVAFIPPAVGPSEHTFAVHFITAPFADILSAVAPGVSTMSLNVVAGKISLVRTAIGPDESSFSVLLAMNVPTIVPGTIGPRLNAFSMLLILQPFAIVLCSVQVIVNSCTMAIVVLPETLVHGAVDMDEPALAVGLVVGPPALVHGSVRPRELTFTSPSLRAGHPLAFVLHAAVKDYYFLCLEVKACHTGVKSISIDEVAELLPNLLDLTAEVLAFVNGAWGQLCVVLEQILVFW